MPCTHTARAQVFTHTHHPSLGFTQKAVELYARIGARRKLLTPAVDPVSGLLRLGAHPDIGGVLRALRQDILAPN